MDGPRRAAAPAAGRRRGCCSVVVAAILSDGHSSTAGEGKLERVWEDAGDGGEADVGEPTAGPRTTEA